MSTLGSGFNSSLKMSWADDPVASGRMNVKWACATPTASSPTTSDPSIRFMGNLRERAALCRVLSRLAKQAEDAPESDSRGGASSVHAVNLDGTLRKPNVCCSSPCRESDKPPARV